MVEKWHFPGRSVREIVASNCGFVSARRDATQNVKLINFIIHKQLYAIMHKVDVICPSRNVATSKWHNYTRDNFIICNYECTDIPRACASIKNAPLKAQIVIIAHKENMKSTKENRDTARPVHNCYAYNSNINFIEMYRGEVMDFLRGPTASGTRYLHLFHVLA